jgi:hypothetical protein
MTEHATFDTMHGELAASCVYGDVGFDTVSMFFRVTCFLEKPEFTKKPYICWD